MAVSFVQSAGLPSANSSTPRTLTTVNEGASLAIECLSAIAAEGITPSAAGVTFTLAQTKNMAGIAMSTRWYVAHGVPAGTVITFTPSATMRWVVDMWEVLGGDGTLGASDSVTNDTTAASSAAAAPGLAVPAGAGVLALFHCDRSPGAITPPTGFSAGTQIVTDENPHYTFSFSRIYSSAASNQRGTLASQASTMNYSAALLVFPAAAGAPVITGPTGAAGAASITHTVNENQAAAGTWTATGSVSWSLTGTDAADLSITGGVVTKASGNFDFETKASYSFNVVNGSASQAVTLNITNLPELQSPTKATPTATTAVIGATVDGTTGQLFGVLTLDNSQPSGAQIEAGQNSAGSTSTVVACIPLTISSTGAKSLAAATVVSGTTRYGWLVYKVAGVYSTVLPTGALYPGTGRPAAGVTASGGWTASTGTDLGNVMNEDAPGSNAEFMTTPTLTGSYQDRDIPLSQAYPPGTYNNLRFTARNVGGNATAKVELLDVSDTVLATSGEQALTAGSFVTFTVGSITIAGTATKWRFSAKAP